MFIANNNSKTNKSMFDFKAIRTIRNEQNVTLTQLEEKTGIRHSNISQIENRKKDGVTLRTVERIIEPLGYHLEMVKNDSIPTQGTTITFKEETL